MQIKTSNPHSTAAFTLVENLIGIAIVAIVAMSFFAGLGFSFSTTQRVRDESRAIQIMSEKMDALRLYSWTQVNTPGFIPRTFSAPYSPAGLITNFYQGTITIASNVAGYHPITAGYSDDLRFVTLELKWQSGPLTQTRRMATLITKEGLQNYIY